MAISQTDRETKWGRERHSPLGSQHRVKAVSCWAVFSLGLEKNTNIMMPFFLSLAPGLLYQVCQLQWFNIKPPIYSVLSLAPDLLYQLQWFNIKPPIYSVLSLAPDLLYQLQWFNIKPPIYSVFSLAWDLLYQLQWFNIKPPIYGTRLTLPTAMSQYQSTNLFSLWRQFQVAFVH